MTRFFALLRLRTGGLAMHITEQLGRENGRDYALRILKDNIIRLELEPGNPDAEQLYEEISKFCRGYVSKCF